MERKNRSFSYHAEGAEASAFYYSLIETANGFERYQYMRYLFEKLPFAESVEDYRKLLPQYIDESQLPKTKKSS
ncbi:MAG: transposase domain-containing protein [Candidatus Aminicenantes bacterium]|nr:transposase domain-containing protein [Candidatus Aminicenantes bacterium]